MDKCIFNESNGLWYELVGDYYLPCLKLPEEEQRPVGIWGQCRKRYLKEHCQALYTALLLSDKLNDHLSEIDEQAEGMFFQLVKQLAGREGVTEQFKAENQMEWVGQMNNIAKRVIEIINAGLIYK